MWELLTGGSALAALGKVSLAVCALVSGLIYRRYLGILGADRRKPAERQAYDALRASLAEGNIAARLYAERLTRFLDWVDRFFGDVDMANRTLFPHAFGLRTPAPLWTAPAFDRCLLLALVYPILTVFVIWVVSGDVGPTQAVLGLSARASVWRGLAAAGMIAFILLLRRSTDPDRWMQFSLRICFAFEQQLELLRAAAQRPSLGFPRELGRQGPPARVPRGTA